MYILNSKTRPHLARKRMKGQTMSEYMIITVILVIILFFPVPGGGAANCSPVNFACAGTGTVPLWETVTNAIMSYYQGYSYSLAMPVPIY